MFLTVVECLEMNPIAFTNPSGATDERSMSRDELAQSMPCKEEEDEVRLQTIFGSHISHCYRSSSSFASGEIVAERRLKTLNCCKNNNNLSILTFV